MVLDLFFYFYIPQSFQQLLLLQLLINYTIETMQSNNLQAKQQYLRQKIIDGGHDPQKFVQFCSEKHNLDDLQNWSLHQLIDIVEAFLKSINPRSSKQASNVGKQQKNKQISINSQIQNPTLGLATQNNNKLGLVLNDDDWSMLLSAPSLLNNKKDNTQQSHLSSLLTLDLNFTQTINKIQQNQNELSYKDFPLSPPSIQNKQKQLQPSSSQPQRQVEQPIMQQIKLDKRAQKKHINEQMSPINLSNIIITTAKQKSLSPLPNINEVSIIKTQQVSRNFLQGDYTLYHINFLPCQIVIQRKFSDLLKLRGILRRLYPFLRLPYLQPEGWMSASEGKDPQTLSRYKWMVEQFIRYVLVKSQQLKNCELVRFFCGFTKKQYTKDEFRKKLQAYQSVPRPKFLGEVILSNNNVLIPPTLASQKFGINTISLINEIDVQYERLRKQLDNLFVNYDLLLKSYSDIGSTFDTIQNLINRYNNQNGNKTSFRSFDGLKEITQRMSVKIIGECQMFKNRIKNLFRFQKDNMSTLKQVIDFSSNIRYQFSRQGSPPLPTNKLKGSDMQIQSQIPLQDPIKNNKPILAVQQIFWSFACRRETDRYWQFLRKKINEGLTLIAYDELDSENQNLNFWNGIIKRSVI